MHGTYRENSLFYTTKVTNSFLDPRKLKIPYLTLLQTFIPNMTLHPTPLANSVNI